MRGLWVPPGGADFAWHTSNILATRPATTMGTSVTPGNNTYGSYTQILSALAEDCYGLLICISSGATSAASRGMLVTIGADPAGGSSYSTVVPDLLCSASAPYNLGGCWYYFPIFIKAGSTVAAKASVNNATVGTVLVICEAFGRPRNKDRARVGSYVTAFGITAASSTGTTVTSGTTSEGAYTALATSTSRPHWWWQVGMGVSNGTMAALVYHFDLAVGDASNKRLIIENAIGVTTAAEQLTQSGAVAGCEAHEPSGVNVYGRMQCSGTPDTGIAMAAYGLGG